MTDQNHLMARCVAYIEDNALCAQEDTVLLAVSGGIDSMVLSDILIKGDTALPLAIVIFRCVTKTL